MLNQVNFNIFSSINNLAGQNSVLDNIAIFLAEYSPYIFIILLIAFWFKKGNYKQIVLNAGFATILGVLINYLIAYFFPYSRPFVEHSIRTLVQHAPDASFPSDHTTFIMSMSFLFLYYKKTRIFGIIFLSYSILAGLARVYVGVHYPLDILGSALVAILASGIIYLLRDKFKKLNNFIIKAYDNLIPINKRYKD